LDEPLSILHEDQHCLAINKPAGQFTQGSWAPPGEETLETAVRRYLDPVNAASVYLGIVHRLDRPTSGVILWAKTEKAARRLSAQFQQRRALKEYWAIVETPIPPAADAVAISGAPSSAEPAAEDVWTDWLSRPDKSGKVSAVEPKTKGAREAVTRVVFEHAVALPAGHSFLRLFPQSGRTHQLRIQAARRGSPIMGDTTYGSSRPFDCPDRITLHARSLTIKHPASGQELTLVAPVPAWWSNEGIIL
jgi:23S rRNA pseudouridine1911/1915/1917 synthase